TLKAINQHSSHSCIPLSLYLILTARRSTYPHTHTHPLTYSHTHARQQLNMAPIAGMRIWVAFVTFINLSVTISYYSYRAHQVEYARKLGELDEEFDPNLGWRDICSIITAVILFGIYAYSAFTRNKATSFIQNKFLRAILILIPTVLLLYIECESINGLRIVQNLMNESRRRHFPEGYDDTFKINIFVCHKENHLCFLMLSHIFLAVITGLFVVVEVAMSFFMSPRPSPRSADF
ncbi:MAG: hypothetical protein J3R72DRAFT_2822, partial [Linnemannia gamsii]